MTIPIIAIVGATAVGKTALSIELAKKFNCEVISIDSVQIYKKFNIGSAKVTEEEMAGVPHHLIDILEPTEKFSVYEFQKLARAKITEVHNKGKIPLLIGGTGYYMNAVLYDYKFSSYITSEEELSLEEMKEYLAKNYPDTYNTIDINNERRVVNAYRYVKEEQKSVTENNEGTNIYGEYNPYIIVLDREREKLYERINKRVDIMFEQGLLKEVSDILTTYGENLQALTSIGYKEVLPYLKNEVSAAFMNESIKQNSRRFAKRQLTWFRNKMFDTHWYDVEKVAQEQIEEDIKNFLAR